MRGEGACVVKGGMRAKGGHAWQRGACVAKVGHVWQRGACMMKGVCMAKGVCMGYDEIRSMSGRYASYWNAFLWIFMKRELWK